ncbi:S26 family peptidase [Arthrobacter crystallopoietes BAB-32]|uniref:S26 family peptidase n=1 Tax=Arthrobacter crystallopoietes BAB-32 TaxID=1246476 RepID=N1UV91_9MICC|nr:S24/S26 family peptidase [Arthrobacter crystallopoietes]EMY34296.1 S26 family peptidase [Arthrobacter crystallopoietes BAB-32]
MRVLNRGQNAALTGGAILGTLCLLLALAGMLAGAKPLIFTSGSMTPTIPAGGLALSLPAGAGDLVAGDVVSVENAQGVRITHRVQAVEHRGATAVLTLKGDANDAVDAERYVVTTGDRVVWSAPLLGYAVAALGSPYAIFAGGLLSAYLLYLAFGSANSPGGSRPSGSRSVGRRSRGRQETATAEPQLYPSETVLHTLPEPEATRERKSGSRRRTLISRAAIMASAVVAMAGAGALAVPAPAQAAFSSAAGATASFGAATLPVPALSCRNDGGSVVLEWAHDSLAVDPTYTVEQSGAVEPWAEGLSASSLAVDAADPRFTSAEPAVITFSVRSVHGLWESTAAALDLSYTPAGDAPATIQCAG